MRKDVYLASGIVLALTVVGAAQARTTTLTGNSCNIMANASYDPSSPGIRSSSSSANASVICPIPLISPSTATPANVGIEISEFNSSGGVSCTLRSYNQSGGIASATTRGTDASYTGTTTLTFAATTIQAGGHLVMECSLPPNTAGGNSSLKHIRVTY